METKTEQAKYTAGPWVAREAYQSGEPSCWTVEPGIADIFNPNTAEANARLISAAPDLLKSLKAMTAIAEGLRDRLEIESRDTPEIPSKPFNDALLAINKAEGR